jgi:hypothetical protein
MNEQEMRELFREMRDEPVPADSLARVRLGVEERVDQRLRKRSWWKLAAPLIAAGCIVAGFFLLRPARTPMPLQPPSTPEIAQVLPPPETPARTTPRPRHVRPRPAKVEPVLIRIETPDPDVVILLVN